MQVEESQRFWNHIATGAVNTCWLWQGYVDKKGWGRFQKSDGSQERAHRAAFILATQQPLQKHSVILQRCGNKLCCNPHHLHQGQSNAARPGERHGQAKLTWKDVRSLRARSQGGETARALAAAFGVAESTVSRVLSGKTWIV